MTESPSTPPEQARINFADMKKGEVYAIDNAAYVVQTMETWTDIGTFIEQLRNVARHQDRRIKELLEQNKDLQTVNADLSERLDNLRSNHRKLVAAGVERSMTDLGLLSPTQPMEIK